MTSHADHATTIDAPEVPSTDAPATLGHARCAVATCAAVISAKWTPLLVRDLARGPQSFSDLQRSLAGISPRTLCDRLKLLATHGMLTRTRIKALPPRSIYELTERGVALLPVIEAMRTAGESMLASAPLAADADLADIAPESCCD